jgi:CBS domain-containing protein
VIDDAGKVVGVVSEADLLARQSLDVSGPGKVSGIPHHREQEKAAGITAEDLMTRPPVTVYSRPDDDIRDDITEGVILDTTLTDPARFTVTVNEGIGTLEGHPETAAVGHDIVEAVRHVEGIVAVRDRLTYPRDAREAPAAGPLS